MEPEITEYTICALPLDHGDAHHFAVVLQWRPGNLWVARRGGWRDYLDRNGEWQHGHEDSDEWRQAHWLDFATAVALAQTAAAELTVNGWTAEQILAGGR